jgi:hypothetical protein
MSGDVTRFEVIGYPGWPRYFAKGFSVGTLIAGLADQIEIRVPQGPICILGVSIGGHLGYAAALDLQARGREIGGFCAIDTFMVSSAAPSRGWLARAISLGSALISNRRFDEFARFLRARFWRALLRLAGDRLPALFRRHVASGRLPFFVAFDPLFTEELNMRLLIRHVAPWIPSLDREPVSLLAPTVLLRTQSIASDDPAWCRRCPNINVIELSGDHQTVFTPENVGLLRKFFIAERPETGVLRPLQVDRSTCAPALGRGLINTKPQPY